MVRTLLYTLGLCVITIASLVLSVAAGARHAVTDGPTHIATVDAPAQKASAKPESFAITHISLIDGTGAPLQRDTTVVISGGRIAHVGQSAAHHRDPRMPEVDGRGKFLLPGLIDTHAHVTYLN
jgi:imidazolonepropionase-like amidohydrolase